MRAESLLRCERIKEGLTHRWEGSLEWPWLGSGSDPRPGSGWCPGVTRPSQVPRPGPASHSSHISPHSPLACSLSHPGHTGLSLPSFPDLPPQMPLPLPRAHSLLLSLAGWSARSGSGFVLFCFLTSGCAESLLFLLFRGYSLVAVQGLLTVVVSLVRLQFKHHFLQEVFPDLSN